MCVWYDVAAELESTLFSMKLWFLCVIRGYSSRGRQHNVRIEGIDAPLLDSRATIIDGYLKWFVGH